MKDFDPANAIVQRCLQGMGMEAGARPEEAGRLFRQAWDEAASDFEKFLAAHFVARAQANAPDRLHWQETALRFASRIDDVAVASAIPTLYQGIASSHEALGDTDKAREFQERAEAARTAPADKGPFFHGTKADLQVGDLLTAGGLSNYKPDLVMNHIYFTALVHGAALAASLAQGEGLERVYVVEPTGSFENDPNVTDKKFPGNLTRSYRSREPLRIVGEIAGWARMTPEELGKWREKLAANKGEIIN